MRKAILRITLAAGLVGVANWAMNNDVEAKAGELKVQEENFNISDTAHPDYNTPEGQNLTLQEAENICPGTGPVCATGDQGTQVRWNGSSNKF